MKIAQADLPAAISDNRADWQLPLNSGFVGEGHIWHVCLSWMGTIAQTSTVHLLVLLSTK